MSERCVCVCVCVFVRVHGVCACVFVRECGVCMCVYARVWCVCVCASVCVCMPHTKLTKVIGDVAELCLRGEGTSPQHLDSDLYRP